MLQTTRVSAFAISELLRANQQEWEGGRGVKFPPTHTPRLALRELFVLIFTDNVIHCHTFTLSEHWLDSIVFYLISDFYYTYLKTLINNKTIIFEALSPKFRKGS